MSRPAGDRHRCADEGVADLVAVTSAWHRLMTRTSLQRRVSVMGGAFLVIVLVLTVLLLGSALRGMPSSSAESTGADQLLQQVDALEGVMVEAQSTHQLYITASDLDRLRTQGAERQKVLQEYDDVRAEVVAAADREQNPTVRRQLEVVLTDAERWRTQVDTQGTYKQQADQARLSASIADEPAATAFLAFYRDLGPLHESLHAIQQQEEDRVFADRRLAREVQFAVAAVSLLLVPAVLYLVRRWVIHPLGSLSEQLLRVGGGDLQTPVSLPGPPELAAVAASAETMRRRILDELADAVSAREALQQGQPLVAEVRDQLTAHDLPVVPGWSSAAALRPAEGLLAGDWYDVLPLKDGRFAVVVADVSGHGARAGIVAIQLKRLLEAALHLAPEPDLALAMAARVFSDEAERFASCVVVVVDPDSGTVTYANAGHPAPLVLRADDGDGVRVVTELEPTGPLLSWLHLDEPGSWRTRTASLAPGSLLVVFTDGLTEARPTGSTDELGIAGVLKALGRLPELTPQALVDEALDVARRHSGGRARDDVTLVAFSRGQGPARVVPSMRDGASETLG